jgi:hypothetical protein
MTILANHGFVYFRYDKKLFRSNTESITSIQKRSETNLLREAFVSKTKEGWNPNFS